MVAWVSITTHKFNAMLHYLFKDADVNPHISFLVWMTPFEHGAGSLKLVLYFHIVLYYASHNTFKSRREGGGGGGSA